MTSVSLAVKFFGRYLYSIAEPEEPAKPSEPQEESHKLTFDELVRKMDESEERLAEAEAAAAAKDDDDEPETKVEEVKIQDDSTETE